MATDTSVLSKLISDGFTPSRAQLKKYLCSFDDPIVKYVGNHLGSLTLGKGGRPKEAMTPEVEAYRSRCLLEADAVGEMVERCSFILRSAQNAGTSMSVAVELASKETRIAKSAIKRLWPLGTIPPRILADSLVCTKLSLSINTLRRWRTAQRNRK